MINRLDNICEAVLKGKWPVNRRQMFDFQGLIPGYTPPTMDSPLQKRSFAELSMVGQASISGSEDLTTSPQLSKVCLFCHVKARRPTLGARGSLVLPGVKTAALSLALFSSYKWLIPEASSSFFLKSSLCIADTVWAHYFVGIFQ